MKISLSATCKIFDIKGSFFPIIKAYKECLTIWVLRQVKYLSIHNCAWVVDADGIESIEKSLNYFLKTNFVIEFLDDEKIRSCGKMSL